MKGSRVRYRALQAAPDPERSGHRIFSVGPCRSPCSSRWGMSLRTRTAPLRRRRGRSRQSLFAPVAVRAGRCTRQGALSTGAFPRPALLASVKGTPAKKKAPEVAAGARSCARRPAVKYGRGAGAPARRRAQSGSTRRVRSIPPEMSTGKALGLAHGSTLRRAARWGTARAVLSHSPTSTVSPI